MNVKIRLTQGECQAHPVLPSPHLAQLSDIFHSKYRGCQDSVDISPALLSCTLAVPLP